ncbi:hypothetical protein SDC9_62813 [bioreactor metagenome]|uniref:Uncharacterized protein n=1 Tax=bioreactor metagenome TaxID=1076179 RepID=A0A644XQB6_9ZZZZ
MIMRGTTTAGETAPRTAPRMAASSKVMPNNFGANKMTARISKVAGKKVIRTAGRPIFLRSPKSIVKPARTRMTIRAIFRISAEMASNSGAIRSIAYGPNRMPVKIKPNSPGSWSRVKNELRRKLMMRIRAILNIKSCTSRLLPLKKPMTDCAYCAEVISLYKRFKRFARGDIYSLGIDRMIACFRKADKRKQNPLTCFGFISIANYPDKVDNVKIAIID